MKILRVLLVVLPLAAGVGRAVAEDREPLERPRRVAPMRELRSTPERRGASDHDDAEDWQRHEPKHEKHERGERGYKDDGDDE